VTHCDSELAIIIDDPRAHSDPSASILQKYNDERIEAISLQISLAEAKEVKETASAGRAMSEEALRKRKTREQKKELEKAKAAAAADPTEDPTSLFVPESSVHMSEPSVAQPSSTPAPATPAYTVIVPPSSSSLPWYTPQASTHTTLASARTAGVWTYPSTLHERAKCGVFRGLWGKGYFMGGGIKFGGDYLVYPGSYLYLLALHLHDQVLID
jgi:tRNA-splicing endonuclease subunit Sen34